MAYDNKAVGRRLKSGMVDKGLTMEQMAEATGLSRASISDYCIGRTVMTLEIASKVCEVLGWPIDRLAVREQ